MRVGEQGEREMERPGNARNAKRRVHCLAPLSKADLHLKPTDEDLLHLFLKKFTHYLYDWHALLECPAFTN